MQGHELLPEHLRPLKRPSLFAGGAFFWMVSAAFALLRLGIQPLYRLVASVFPVDPTAFTCAVQVDFYLGVLLLPITGYLLSRQGMEDSFRLNPIRFTHAVRSVIVACAGFMAASFLTELWLVLLEVLGADVMSGARDALSGNLILDLFVVAVMPGICEELLFRGLLLATYERWGTWKAIWITSLMFMGMHGSIEGMAAELLIGAALGYAAASTGTLYAPIMLHTVYNAITLMVAYGAGGESTAQAGTSLMAELGGMGGICVVALLAVVFIGLFMASLKLLDSPRRKAGLQFGNDTVIEVKRLERSEIVLLFSAIATVIWFYVDDALVLFGGLL